MIRQLDRQVVSVSVFNISVSNFINDDIYDSVSETIENSVNVSVIDSVMNSVEMSIIREVKK